MESLGRVTVNTVFDLKNERVTEWRAEDNQETVYTLEEYYRAHFDSILAKKYFAEKGQYVDVLVRDEDPEVRRALARNGHGVDVLVRDKDYTVRAELAKHGYGLDALLHDAHYYVRLCVAEQGYGLDVLINDECDAVRLAVARQGYYLAALAGDESERVRVLAQKLRGLNGVLENAYEKAGCCCRELDDLGKELG